MTDEERKQFINEYCRNVGDIKIKCDDCKFVEDCVDYGWQGCKKFTPKPSEPMTKLCDTCEYLKFCARSGIEDVGCDRYKRDTTTNEEWLKQCNTEQLAEWLKDTLARCYRCGGCDELAERNCTVKICYYADVVEWLKQPHTFK